jgi:hypothetical protein
MAQRLDSFLSCVRSDTSAFEKDTGFAEKRKMAFAKDKGEYKFDRVNCFKESP